MNKADVKSIRAALQAACVRESEYFEELYIPDFEYSQKHDQRIYELKVECDKRLRSLSVKRAVALIIAASLVVLALTGATVYVEVIKDWFKSQDKFGPYYQYQGELKDTIEEYVFPSYIPENFSHVSTGQFADCLVFTRWYIVYPDGSFDSDYKISITQSSSSAGFGNAPEFELINIGGVEMFLWDDSTEEMENYRLDFVRYEYSIEMEFKSLPWQEVEKVVLSLELFDDVIYDGHVIGVPGKNAQ
jgi:hypothetical protein